MRQVPRQDFLAPRLLRLSRDANATQSELLSRAEPGRYTKPAFTGEDADATQSEHSSRAEPGRYTERAFVTAEPGRHDSYP